MSKTETKKVEEFFHGYAADFDTSMGIPRKDLVSTS